MTSGLQTLHDIDKAIAKARRAVHDASQLPHRVSRAMADVQRKQNTSYTAIARLRLGALDEGIAGEELGYVDRQAEKLLDAHDEAQEKLSQDVDESSAAIAQLETERRSQEKIVAKAIEAYDKSAAACQAKLTGDPAYIAQLDQMETAESMVARAEQKLNVAREDEAGKGAAYETDPLFQYLQRRGYGTREPKGWALTRALDGWVARLIGYKDAAINYRSLKAIPTRIAAHVERLKEGVILAQAKLQKTEQDMLESEGVKALHESSLSEQAKLDAIDANIAKAEAAHQDLLTQQAKAAAGESGPYEQAVHLLSEALKRKGLSDLRILAAQTVSRDDDRAVADIAELEITARDLKDDQKEAQILVKKYQKSLADLEKVRRRFKQRRYDAPSSTFPTGRVIGGLLAQVLAGALDGDDIWRQLERAQRTIRRHSDIDFGGIDWTEGLRLPRGRSRSRNRSRRGGGISFPSPRGRSSGRSRSKRPTRRSSGGRKRGGFKTGNRF